MKKIIFLFLIINQTLLGQNVDKNTGNNAVSNPNFNATASRLTTDHKGNPVLSWAEQDDSSRVLGVYFATSKDGGKTFLDQKMIKNTEGVASHAEGMPKIAFKSDGTIIATFEMRRPTPESRFAGDILYTMSTDGGENWTPPQYVHADTTAGKSRSFHDIVRLPNGEIGITWLGERGKTSGRPVKFAQTTAGNGFGNEIIAKSGACECCRTNLMVDTEGVLHIFFRDILPDGTRDMGHVLSKNGGKNFGDYKLVYPDKWKINACPHTGPSSAVLKNTIYTAWYTGEEENLGVKITDNAGKILTHIKNANARHPQLTATKSQLVLAWDEVEDGQKETKIRIQWLTKDKIVQTKTLEIGEYSAAFPTILALNDKVIVAYERQKNGEKKTTEYKILEEKEF